MSGGIDSSVAAALLRGADFELTGIFMRLFPGSPRFSEKRARKIAQILKIPFYVLNFEKEFKKKVVDYFLKEYKKGRTPNPCVICNKEIKFGLLLEKALGLDADFVATGHYARIVKNVGMLECWNDKNRTFLTSERSERSNKQSDPTFRLFRAKDEEKDQSYFLWQLNQKQLSRILFPIGDYTKKEVRSLAKKFKLPVLDIPESQKICFIPNTNLSEFLKSRIKANKRKIITTQGKIIGEHQGLPFYTIGQRKGLGLAGGPWYVLAKDSKRNVLVVTKNEKDLLKKELIAKNVNWISDKIPKLPLKVKAKIRSRVETSSATIYHLKPNTYHLVFEKPQRAITPGQSVVFFLPRRSPQAKAGQDQELLGGGIIEK